MTEKNHLSSGALPRPSGGAGGGAVVKGLVDKIKQKITYPPLPASAEEAPGLFLQALTVHTWRVFFLMVSLMVVCFLIGVIYFDGDEYRRDGWFLLHLFSDALKIFPFYFIPYMIGIAFYGMLIGLLQKKYGHESISKKEIIRHFGMFYCLFLLGVFLGWVVIHSIDPRWNRQPLYVTNVPLGMLIAASILLHKVSKGRSGYFGLFYCYFFFCAIFSYTVAMFMLDFTRGGRSWDSFELAFYIMCVLLVVLTAASVLLRRSLRMRSNHGENNEEKFSIYKKICMSLVMMYWITAAVAHIISWQWGLYK